MAEDRGQRTHDVVRDYFKLALGKQIAANTAAMAHAAQQQARATAEQQASDARRHARNIERIERERLSVLQRQEQLAQQRQALRADLFSVRTGLDQLQSKLESDPLMVFVTSKWSGAQLHEMPVREIGEHEHMVLHAELLSLAERTASAAREKVPSDADAVEAIMGEHMAVAAAAQTLDDHWHSTQIQPLEIQSNELRLEIHRKTSEQRAKHKAASKKGGMALWVVLLVLGIMVILGTLIGPPDGEPGKPTKEIYKQKNPGAAIALGAVISVIGGIGVGIVASRRSAVRLAAESFDRLFLRRKREIDEELARIAATLEATPQTPCRDFLADLQIAVPGEEGSTMELPAAAGQFKNGLRNMRGLLRSHGSLTTAHFMFADALRTADPSEARELVKRITKTTIECPDCRAGLSVSADAEGKTARCPRCRTTFTISLSPSRSPRTEPSADQGPGGALDGLADALGG